MMRNNNNNNKSSSSTASSSTTQSEEEMADLRRGPWTVEEDFKLINYIATHGEGRWNSLARCAGLKRTGKSCRLRWLNYLRPDVRRGNITLEEQLMILELHSRWGNRWSKIAQHLPGRTDNEIKNYWRTRVQKHAKQLKCDVNSKQFKDAMRYLWMPRLIERIQASTATAPGSTAAVHGGTGTAIHAGASTATAPIAANLHPINNEAHLVTARGLIGTDFGVAPSYATENSSTSDSFGTHVSPVSDLTTDYYNFPVNHDPNPDYYQAGQVNYPDSIISPSSCYFNQGLDYEAMEQNHDIQWMDGGGDASASLWNAEDIWFSQQQLNNTHTNATTTTNNNHNYNNNNNM